jgi:hypothetical protein
MIQDFDTCILVNVRTFCHLINETPETNRKSRKWRPSPRIVRIKTGTSGGLAWTDSEHPVGISYFSFLGRRVEKAGLV